MKIAASVTVGLLLIAEGLGAWYIFGHFERTPAADASFPDYASVLLPAILFTLALAVISARPLRFVLLVFLTGFGSFLLFVTGLWGIDRVWAGGLSTPGLFLVNLGLALAAPIPLLAVLTGFRRDGLQATGVALLYGGFCSLGYKLQYGPQIQLLQWELIPLWGCWIGILVWHLFLTRPASRAIDQSPPRHSGRDCRNPGALDGTTVGAEQLPSGDTPAKKPKLSGPKARRGNDRAERIEPILDD